jgi:hypothetical protein
MLRNTVNRHQVAVISQQRGWGHTLNRGCFREQGEDLTKSQSHIHGLFYLSKTPIHITETFIVIFILPYVLKEDKFNISMTSFLHVPNI